MLEVQKFLMSNSVESLQEEFGIKNTIHSNLPLVILNYCMINSPKSHPIVKECRSLVLNKNDWSIVGKSFNRFFNWGEFENEMKFFNFSSFNCLSKEDGSLILFYYYDNKWRVNTRSTFANENMQHQDFTWEEGICRALNISNIQEIDSYLDRKFSYVGEFCSLWNKVVRKYPEPKVYLLAVFCNENEVIDFEKVSLFKNPEIFHFNNIEDIQNHLKERSKNDPTFEGVVINDGSYRWKLKNAAYLALHNLSGNGNIFNPKNLMPFILNGDSDELLLYFPEVRSSFEKYKRIVDEMYAEVLEVWEQSDHSSQKNFALSIKGKTPFTGMLFEMKKGKKLPEIWEVSEEIILKNVKSCREHD